MELLLTVEYVVFRHQTCGSSEMDGKENERCKYIQSEIRKWVKQLKLTQRTKLQGRKEKAIGYNRDRSNSLNNTISWHRTAGNNKVSPYPGRRFEFVEV
jgi:hypothetical protein